jgi:2-phospho-L-lactate guanylyltransferase
MMTVNPQDVLIAVPVKPFGVAKRRLRPVLDTHQRSQVGKAVAGHVIAQARATGSRVAVVTGDDGVADWANTWGAEVIREPADGGLDLAAGAAVTAARMNRYAWMVVHADLPAATTDDLSAAVHALPARGILLAPSHDGGTNLLAGDCEAFAFSYGPHSFHRHLAAAARLPHRVLVRAGLALDLDGPDDLQVLAATTPGRWLARLLADLTEPTRSEGRAR